jgi:hypothetical protein
MFRWHDSDPLQREEGGNPHPATASTAQPLTEPGRIITLQWENDGGLARAEGKPLTVLTPDGEVP